MPIERFTQLDESHWQIEYRMNAGNLVLIPWNRGSIGEDELVQLTDLAEWTDVQRRLDLLTKPTAAQKQAWSTLITPIDKLHFLGTLLGLE